MENFNKLKALTVGLNFMTNLTKDKAKQLGIKDIQTDLGEKSITINYLNGTSKTYTNKDVTKVVDELVKKTKELESDVLVKYHEFEETVKDNFLTISSEQVANLQEKLKGLEVKLKEAQKDKVKVKTITITETIHNKVKKFCAENDLQISDWVGSTLTQGISDFKKEVTFNDKTGEIKIKTSKKK